MPKRALGGAFRVSADGKPCSYRSLPLSTHQRGWARDKRAAAHCAASADRNRPKQVAPDPDIRDSMQPGWRASAASTSPITGARAGRRIRRAAADPRRGRQALFEGDGHRRRPGEFGGLPDQVAVIFRHAGGARTGHPQRHLRRRLDRDAVFDGGKGHQAVEQVVAVLAAPRDMERQVDLGRSGLSCLRCWFQAAPPLPRPAPCPGRLPACAGSGRDRLLRWNCRTR